MSAAKRYGAGLTKQERRSWNRETDAILKSRTAKPSAAGRRLKAQHDEQRLRAAIVESVDALVRADAKPGEPDAWMRLVLRSMSVEELRLELASGTLSADESRWMNAELIRQEKGAK